MQGNLLEFADLVKQSVIDKFNAWLDLVELSVEALILPEELRKAYQEGAQINLMGGMDRYAKKRTLDAMNTAAANEGNGSFAGMGAGFGTGAAIGNIMGNVSVEWEISSPSIQSIPCREPGNNLYRL